MPLVAVRHARAGKRGQWPHGPDRERPLDERGTRQAAALVDIVGPLKPSRLISSPFTRCRQTFGPLAEHLGLALEPRDELGEDGEGGLELLLGLIDGPATVAACIHGDLLGELLHHLRHPRPRKSKLPKGGTWVIKPAGPRDGDLPARIQVIPPGA